MNKEEEENRRQIESLSLEKTAGFKNLIAIKDYTTKTRDMFRNLQKENEIYKNQIKQQNLALELMRKQIQTLQVNLMQIKNTTK